MDRESEFERAASPDDRDQMEAARAVAQKNWVVLRALALSDQNPDLDVSALLEMATRDSKRR